MSGFLTPPPFKPEMAKEKIDSTYKNYRWQVFLGIFIGSNRNCGAYVKLSRMEC